MSNSRFYTFDRVVRDICATMGDDEAKKYYVRVARIVNGLLESLNLHLFPSMKSELMSIDSSLCIDLPSDTVSVVKVGLLCEGKIILLGRDASIRIPQSMPSNEQPCTCATTLSTTPASICPSCTFYNVNLGGTIHGELYGVMNRQNAYGFFRFNESLNRLEFSSGEFAQVGTQVLVEYKTTSEGNKLIPKEAYQLLLFAANEQMNLDKPGVAGYSFNRMKIEYERLKSLYLQHSAQDIVNAYLSGRIFGIK